MGFLIAWLLFSANTPDDGAFAEQQKRYPRVRRAFAAHRTQVRQRFDQRRAAWPPEHLLLRAYKHEGVIEVWARGGPGRAQSILVRELPICAASGTLGPKSQAGDLQVPEGVYYVDRFNPVSAYHLSLGINYPNAADRRRSSARNLGGDIFIHGGCVTIGCLPISDRLIEELYVMAVLARSAGQRQIPVQIVPCRGGTARCQAALRRHPALRPFWRRLAKRVGQRRPIR
jgi:murein L,D-transpeptidase YafK